MSQDDRLFRSQPDRAGLRARFLGMITSPRDTFARVVEDPGWLDMTILITVVAAVCAVGFLVTDVGGQAALDQQVRQLEAFGIDVTDQLYQRLDQFQRYVPYLAAAYILVGWPLLWILLAGILHAVFNAGLGGDVAFRQVFAVVVHSWSVYALQAVLVAPLDYVRESRGGATSLGLLFPMLAEGSLPARALGAIDVFTVWWISLLAVGLGVLFRTRSGPVAARLFGIYAAGAVALAIIQTLRGGT